MKTTIWLRISSILSLLFAAGHLLGGRQNWSPVADNPVLQSMRTVRFDVMGMSRSYLDLYMGFGYSIAISLLLQSAVLWILGNAARTHASLVRPLIAAFAVATAVSGLIAWRYIFLIPALFSLALCITLIAAFIAASRVETAFIAGPRR